VIAAALLLLVPADVVHVHDGAALRKALASARAGTTIYLAPGTYAGDVYVTGLKGAPGRPIVLAAAGPRTQPTILRGGTEGLHLSEVEHVEVRDLVIEGASGNGLNVDDGGRRDRPSRHVLLRGITVRDVGPHGNCDGIKLSGLVDFRIEGCTVERWGSGGSAIDMVGCHRGTIERCTIRGRPRGGEYDEPSTGVQAKGGSSAIAVRRSRFEEAGARAVQIGGSTDLSAFRPPLGAPPHAEARDVRVEGNEFLGGEVPVAFVGADRSVFRFNTIHAPRKWAVRILQETRESGFVPCRGGSFTDNVVVFRKGAWTEGGVNVGPDTASGTFTFARNVWFCLDDPERTGELVRLPVTETDGVLGRDPLLRDADGGDLRLGPDSPAQGAGFEALPR